MDGIFFLFLAFVTSILSIKLSKFGDILSKQSKIGSMFIGGLLIASITSLPEFVTCISASIIDNPTLSLGDILGSNFFNVFALAVFNIVFFKKFFLKNIKPKYIFECLILLVSYFFVFLACKNIGMFLSSTLLIVCYVIYMISLFFGEEVQEKITLEKDKYIILKFFLTGLFMIILSILLTLEADKISRMYPSFSSSTIGAILLGVTTSLPEVVTTFELIRLNNFNMAISNILGSNIFNFLVLATSDFIFRGGYIYSYVDKYSFSYLYGGMIVLTLLMLTITKSNKKNIFYTVCSLLIILIYFVVWYLQFA